MKVQVICEKCNSIVELIPRTDGQHASVEKIEDKFHIQEIELYMDYNVDEIEEVTGVVDKVRIDCKNCGEYIVLNDFPRYIYSYY